jgi:pimeloyl-ACP methyl ester carboxylesterase
MKEKSRWFYSAQTEKTKAVVLIAGGLNLDPKKMDTLALFFSRIHCDVLRIAIGPDPLQWEDKFADDYDRAREHADVLGLPLYFVGYSLGALLGLHFMSKHSDHLIKRIALFAPATQTKAFTKITAWLALLFPKGSLPSLNLTDYRDRNYTTFAEYKKMHEIQKEIHRKTFHVPALIFSNPKDELIDHRKLEKFAGMNAEWKVMALSNQGSPLSRKYHHLMIDDQSLGRSEWEKILKNLSIHFSL